MSKKTLTILSIDFDFFQIVDEETIRTCYPDGHDNSTELSMFVWSSYYANQQMKQKLTAVKADTEKINQLQNILDNCKSSIPVLATNSHVHIYDFIHQNMDKHQANKLNLINIDMHHDMFNDNEKLDCGNWISHIKNDYDTNLTWIANPISRNVYGMSDDKFNIIETTFDTIKPNKIDAIFLCRSDTWLPPHLDYAFCDFLYYLCDKFTSVKGEKNIMSERDMTKLVNELSNIYNKLPGGK